MSQLTNQNRVRLFRDRRDNGVRPELRQGRRRPLEGLPQARVVPLSGTKHENVRTYCINDFFSLIPTIQAKL